mmetsp:Transcript_42725/g.105306  ORF Transcript_42725/g.105306 Transcript_42725/m.105306 type:complete len:425 (+) Transcript_42725:66-1340(+)
MAAPYCVREHGTDAAVWLIDAGGGAQLLAGASTATKARVSSVLSRVFLPEGWPDSVRPEYLQYQRWDTLQALCSYLRGILTTTAILEASGVGRESASPLAAAVAWVMRDGFGMLGSLVFAFAVGGQFDAAVKEWRLFADLINDVGLTLDMLAPLFPAHFVLVTSLGAMCKTMCGVAAGATRASITAHFALRDNLADVSTKEGAQETAVSLVGLVFGLALAQHAQLSRAWSHLLFLALTAVHVLANYRGVRCLCLSSLNTQRAELLVAALVEGKPTDRESIAREERVFRWPGQGPVRLGASLGDTFTGLLAGAAFSAASQACAGERHVLWPVGARVHVLLADGCNDGDYLRAFAHAQLLLRARGGAGAWPPTTSKAAVGERTLSVGAALVQLEALHPKLAASLKTHGWSVRTHLGVQSCRYSWDL